MGDRTQTGAHLITPRSKLEATLPGRVRQGLHPAVVDIAAPVKSDLVDL